MKRGVVNAEIRLCEACGTVELACGALRKILKESDIRVSTLLIRPTFLKQHQAPVEVKICHVSTHSMISAFSLGSMTSHIDQGHEAPGRG